MFESVCILVPAEEKPPNSLIVLSCSTGGVVCSGLMSTTLSMVYVRNFTIVKKNGSNSYIEVPNQCHFDMELISTPSWR